MTMSEQQIEQLHTNTAQITETSFNLDKLKWTFGTWRLLLVLGFAISVTWGTAIWYSSNKNSIDKITDAQKDIKQFVLTTIRQQSDSSAKITNAMMQAGFDKLNEKVDKQNEKIERINEKCDKIQYGNVGVLSGHKNCPTCVTTYSK